MVFSAALTEKSMSSILMERLKTGERKDWRCIWLTVKSEKFLMIGQCQARVLFQQKACICESKCLHERCFETNRLMTLVTSFLYKYLVSSKVNSEGINPLIRKSKVAKAESASGYCQTNKLSQLSGRWSTQNLLFSLIHVSKACLVLVRRERSLGLRAGHCQMCSQVSLSSLQRKQFQLFL